MTVIVNPKKITLLMLKINMGLVLLNILGQVIGILIESKSGSAFLEFSQKQSILRLYSTQLLVLCSTLFLFIALKRKGESSGGYYYWMGLFVIFFFLAIAKDTSLDEQLGALLQILLGISRSTVFVIAYAVAMIIIPAIYLKFFLHLPANTKIWFVAGSITFLTGAFLLDLLTAYLGRMLDYRTITYIISSSLEVLLESSGIIILIFTLLSFISIELNVEKVEFLIKQ